MTETPLTAPGANHPLNQVGATVTIDVIASARQEYLPEYHATLELHTVIRHTVTIVEARDVHRLWEAAHTRRNPDTIPHALGLRAITADGTEWTRDWDGAHNDGTGPWIHRNTDGTTTYGIAARSNDTHLLAYTRAGRGYTITPAG
jgi:hypothetical protein